MINLLPPQYKEGLKQEENWKIILLLGILFLVFLFCLALILLSVKIYISNKIESQKVLFQQEEGFKVLEEQGLEEKIKINNQTLLKLDSFYRSGRDLTSLIKEISEILPLEIYLTDISFRPCSADKKCKFQVSLFGFSLSREALFEFKENLLAQENFESVFLPLSSWVEPRDINFSLTFKIK